MSAATFSYLLRQAMKQQGRQVVEFAEEVGVHPSTVVVWRRGKLPSMTYAVRIADALVSPSLLETVAAERTLECPRCGRSFVYDNTGGRKRTYCSQQCARSAWDHAKSGERRLEWGRVHTKWRNRAQKIQKAIDMMCNECADWEGVCRIAACPLREVSPLPLAKEDIA